MVAHHGDQSEVTDPQADLFLPAISDPPLRDNRDAMEHPFLALQKRRVKPIQYENGKVKIEVSAPDKYGIATIWDWDIVIGIASHINEAIESGQPHSKRVSFAPFNLLRTIKRGTGGKDYRELAAAIRRLFATTIITNIRADDRAGVERPFRWLEDYAIPTRYTKAITPDDDQGEADPTKPWTVELPEWLYNAIIRRKDILAVHEHYFDITSGIGRAMYRLARKSVPDDGLGVWPFRMKTLHHRLGVTSSLREFARMVREIADDDELPEYHVIVTKRDGHELVQFIRDKARPPRARRGVYKP